MFRTLMIAGACWIGLISNAGAEPIPISLAPSHFQGTVDSITPNRVILDTAYGQVEVFCPPATFRVDKEKNVPLDHLARGIIVRIDYPRMDGILAGIDNQLIAFKPQWSSAPMRIPISALPRSNAEQRVYARLNTGAYVQVPLEVALFLASQQTAEIVQFLPPGAVLAPYYPTPQAYGPAPYAYNDPFWYGPYWWGYPYPYWGFSFGFVTCVNHVHFHNHPWNWNGAPRFVNRGFTSFRGTSAASFHGGWARSGWSNNNWTHSGFRGGTLRGGGGRGSGGGRGHR